VLSQSVSVGGTGCTVRAITQCVFWGTGCSVKVITECECVKGNRGLTNLLQNVF
jgi:hypothetical protein